MEELHCSISSPVLDTVQLLHFCSFNLYKMFSHGFNFCSPVDEINEYMLISCLINFIYYYYFLFKCLLQFFALFSIRCYVFVLVIHTSLGI